MHVEDNSTRRLMFKFEGWGDCGMPYAWSIPWGLWVNFRGSLGEPTCECRHLHYVLRRKKEKIPKHIILRTIVHGVIVDVVYKQKKLKIGHVREFNARASRPKKIHYLECSINAWTLRKPMIRITSIDVLNLLEHLDPYNIEHQNPKHTYTHNQWIKSKA